MKTVTVDTTAGGTTICAAGFRKFAHIQNVGSVDVYLKYDGSATALTTSNGIKLSPSEWLVLNNLPGQPLFTDAILGIVASGSADVRVQGVD